MLLLASLAEAMQLKPVFVRNRNLIRQAGCKAALILLSIEAKCLMLFKLTLVQTQRKQLKQTSK